MLLVSGGLISSIAIYDMASRGEEFTALLFISDGISKEQARERDAAKLLCAYKDVELLTVDISTFRRQLKAAALYNKAKVGEQTGEYEDNQAETEVSIPFPPTLMTGMAEALAETLGIKDIVVCQKPEEDVDLFAMAEKVGLPLTLSWCPWKEAYQDYLNVVPATAETEPKA